MGDLPRMARRVASSWNGAPRKRIPRSSFSSDSTLTSSSSFASSNKFSGAAWKHVCGTRGVSLVPMKLVSMSPTTLLKSIEDQRLSHRRATAAKLPSSVFALGSSLPRGKRQVAWISLRQEHKERLHMAPQDPTRPCQRHQCYK